MQNVCPCSCLQTFCLGTKCLENVFAMKFVTSMELLIFVRQGGSITTLNMIFSATNSNCLAQYYL